MALSQEEIFGLISTLTHEGKLTYTEMMEWDFRDLIAFFEYTADRLKEIRNASETAATKQGGNANIDW